MGYSYNLGSAREFPSVPELFTESPNRVIEDGCIYYTLCSLYTTTLYKYEPRAFQADKPRTCSELSSFFVLSSVFPIPLSFSWLSTSAGSSRASSRFCLNKTKLQLNTTKICNRARVIFSNHPDQSLFRVMHVVGSNVSTSIVSLCCQPPEVEYISTMAQLPK